MTEPDGPVDGGERLFDVVLREQFARDAADEGVRAVLGSDPRTRELAWQRAQAADQATTPVVARLWMPAAALLGVAVVLAAMWWRSDAVHPAGTGGQDPATRQEVEPRDRAQFLELLAQATAIRVQGAEIVGATTKELANGVADVLDLVPLAPIERIEGEAVQAWREQFVASAAAGESQLPLQYTWTLWFELADGRQMRASWGAGSGARIRVAANDDGIDPNQALAQRLLDAMGSVLRRHRQSIGKAEDAAELLALPVESTRIECPWFADGRMTEHLARFPRLETFVLAKGAGAGLDATGLQQLAAIKTLRSLDLRAAELSGLELGPLADLPALTSLALRGLHKTPVLTALAPRIAELTLEQCDLLGDFHWLRICTRLRTLRLVDSFPPSSATELLAPPNLVNLTVRTKDRRHGAALFAALPMGKLQSLRLVDVPVTGRELAGLAALPSLRELAVLSPSLGDADVQDLGDLKQLTTLRLMNGKVSADGLAELQQALPKCTIDHVPGRRVFDSGTWILP